jgi:hypothetical protein
MYKGKRIKVGFAINEANPASNTHPAYVAGLGFLKTGKLQFQNNLYRNAVMYLTLSDHLKPAVSPILPRHQ